jgi:AcrR family transcriptional regulator
METQEPRRDRQTRRTKRALVAAADEIFSEGRAPTVAEVAERADISRATAYRYFPTQEALLLEATYLGDPEPLRSLPELVEQIPDHAQRAAEFVRRSAEWALERESRLRTLMRMSLEHQDVVRPARRKGYIAQLLEPARDELSDEAYEHAAAALTLLLGADPIVSLRDNSDIAPERIPGMLAWTAGEVVRAALVQSQE